MYVCLCAQVTSTQWNKTLRDQKGDWRQASEACGAGQGCGCCRDYLSAVPASSEKPAAPNAEGVV